MRNRDEILKEALQVKIDQSRLMIEFFTADDILEVAGVGKEDVDRLIKKGNSEIENFIKSLSV